MKYRDAIVEGRRALEQTGLIQLERNRMVAIPQDNIGGNITAQDVADAYNKLAELGRMIEAGELVTIGDSID